VVASARPSGLKAAPKTGSRWPLSSWRHWPVLASHSRGVSSALTVAKMAWLGLKAAVNTGSECPRRVCATSPVATSHIIAVVSSLAVASSAPSGENATEFTAPL
jgi:hypothetical protein